MKTLLSSLGMAAILAGVVTARADEFVDLQNEITALLDQAKSAVAPEACGLCETAINKIDVIGYENLAALEKLDALREDVLRQEFSLACGQKDAQRAVQIIDRMRREHPNGNGWILAGVSAAGLFHFGGDAYQALLSQETHAAAAYTQARQLLQPYEPGPLPPLVLQNLVNSLAPYRGASSGSAMRCQWMLANAFIQNGQLREGVVALEALATQLLPSGGSVFNGLVREKLFKTALPALETITDPQEALDLCKRILTVQEAGNEQNLPVRRGEESVRARLLARKAVLATRANNDADVSDALATLDAWFPTEDIAWEARRAVADARGLNSSAYAGQIVANQEARRILAPLAKAFHAHLRALDAEGADRMAITQLAQDSYSAFMNAAEAHQNTGPAIELMIEIGRRIRANKELQPQAYESLSRAYALLGRKSGWVAFRCWDALSEVLLYRRDPASIALCDATLSADPILLRQLDAHLKRAMNLMRTDTNAAATAAAAGMSLTVSADTSMQRMIGSDSLTLMKCDLALWQTSALSLAGRKAEASQVIASIQPELSRVNPKYAPARQRLQQRTGLLQQRLRIRSQGDSCASQPR